MIKAILFDLDGTLLDTLPDIAQSVNEMLRLHGYPAISEELTRAYIGNGARELVERALPAGADTDACFETFTQVFSHNKGDKTQPFAGVVAGLLRLKAQGYKLAVITNKPRYATETLVAEYFPDLFDYIVGDDGTFPRKPDPTAARYCALTLRVPCGECLFVGDGETDVLAAKNAGMRGVAVLWGYRTRAQLAAAGAVDFVHDFAELENFVKNS